MWTTTIIEPVFLKVPKVQAAHRPCWALVLSCIWNLWVGVAWGLENRLRDHPSPYLAMHAQDPVHWQAWGPEILAQAQREGKLIFISSGYFSCHWCHVMQRESYRNPRVADLLNRHFIPVKLDRELNPALDAHLIDFVQRTQGHAGWPLNVFLTPQGYPVVGSTYLPPERFIALLEKLTTLWQTQRAHIERLAQEALNLLLEARQNSPKDDQAPIALAQLQQNFIEDAVARADELAGGFGQQNRFPMFPQMQALLELQKQQPNARLGAFLDLTLQQMAHLGLRDHLAGGFFRYTIDPGWMTPHYEKMLYTQALLAILYLDAAKILKKPEYAAVAQDTLRFVLREMKGTQGGYVASFSAVDEQGEEGGYYLWTTAELKRILTPAQEAVARLHWRFDRAVQENEPLLPLRGLSAKAIGKRLNRSTAEVEGQIEQARQKLLNARAKRGLPVDHKELAGWNGLLLVALAQASQDWPDVEFATAAQGLSRFLRNRLWDGQRLHRALDKQGQVVAEASLGDYAYVAAGLWAWSEVSNSLADRLLAERLLMRAWDNFYDEKKGWRSSQQALLPGMPAAHAQEDGALPAPSAWILAYSLQAQNPQLRQRARRQLPLIRQQIQPQPFWHASHIRLLAQEQADR